MAKKKPGRKKTHPTMDTLEPWQRWHRSPADTKADRRWIMTEDGRRIGHMWPEVFEAYCEAEFGEYWIGKVAAYLGMSAAMVAHYKHGRRPIPKYIARLIYLRRQYNKVARQNRKNDAEMPLVTPWLDDESAYHVRGGGDAE